MLSKSAIAQIKKATNFAIKGAMNGVAVNANGVMNEYLYGGLVKGGKTSELGDWSKDERVTKVNEAEANQFKQLLTLAQTNEAFHISGHSITASMNNDKVVAYSVTISQYGKSRTTPESSISMLFLNDTNYAADEYAAKQAAIVKATNESGHLGKTFTRKGVEYVVCEFKPANRKYPIIAHEVSKPHRRFKWSLAVVA